MPVIPTLNTYSKGTKVRCKAWFRDAETDALVDPTTVRMGYITPFSSASVLYTYPVDPQVIRVSQGVYYFDLALNEVGDWWYGAQATGTYEGAYERKICCRAGRLF